MRTLWRTFLLSAIALAVPLTLAAWWRTARVNRAAAAIPVYPAAREGARHVRYLPIVLSWDDRSSARVRRIFALPKATPLSAIGRHADTALARQGWYLVMPEELYRIQNPQVIVWQREPDERLDLTQLWPLQRMTREQRMYGGIFPAKFLDATQVVEWTWALGGARVPRPSRADR